MTISRKRRKEIEAIGEEEIEYSDISETDAAFWADAELVRRDKIKPITLPVKE